MSVFYSEWTKAPVLPAEQQMEHQLLLSGKHYEAYYFSNSLKQYLNCLQYNPSPLSALLLLLHLKLTAEKKADKEKTDAEQAE